MQAYLMSYFRVRSESQVSIRLNLDKALVHASSEEEARKILAAHLNHQTAWLFSSIEPISAHEALRLSDEGIMTLSNTP